MIYFVLRIRPFHIALCVNHLLYGMKPRACHYIFYLGHHPKGKILELLQMTL